jgi:hypothetical protein
MQSSSSGRVFNPGLVGASPTTDANLWLNANCPRSSDRLERRSAKAEVAGAIPAVDANFELLCLQQLQGEFRKLVFVGASPTRGPHFNGDHDVTAASRPVKAFVPVRIRLVTPIL